MKGLNKLRIHLADIAHSDILVYQRSGFYFLEMSVF